jgi:hypothetical protein
VPRLFIRCRVDYALILAQRPPKEIADQPLIPCEWISVSSRLDLRTQCFYSPYPSSLKSADEGMGRGITHAKSPSVCESDVDR